MVTFGRRLLAMVFPERCAACGDVIAVGRGVCEQCEASLPRIGYPICPFCGLEKAWCRCRKRRRHYDRVIAPFYYDGVVEKGVLRLKESGDRQNAAYYAEEMADTVRQYYDEYTLDGVVYVPDTAKHERERGFNPARLVAEELATALSLPLLSPLHKIYETTPQKSLPAMERSGNLLGAFDLVPGACVEGKTLLLVDDVVTTGATLDECAKMLKIYGAQTVLAVTAAASRMEKA